MTNKKDIENPGIDTELFDRLLDDIASNMVDRIANSKWKELPQSLYMATWDVANRRKAWVNMDVLEIDCDEEVILSAAGRIVVDGDKIPVAVWWSRHAAMRVSRDNVSEAEEFEGIAVFGMTSDGRVNASFIAVEDGMPSTGKMFYASDDGSDNSIKTQALDGLFATAKEAISERSGGSNNLVRDLFGNVGDQK